MTVQFKYFTTFFTFLSLRNLNLGYSDHMNRDFNRITGFFLVFLVWDNILVMFLLTVKLSEGLGLVGGTVCPIYTQIGERGSCFLLCRLTLRMDIFNNHLHMIDWWGIGQEYKIGNWHRFGPLKKCLIWFYLFVYLGGLASLTSLLQNEAIKFYRKYLMCQNILYYWQYKQKQIVICFEAFNFYCGRSEDFTIVSWLDICSKQGSHFISLSNIYNFTFKKQRISSIFLFTHL